MRSAYHFHVFFSMQFLQSNTTQQHARCIRHGMRFGKVSHPHIFPCTALCRFLYSCICFFAFVFMQRLSERLSSHLSLFTWTLFHSKHTDHVRKQTKINKSAHLPWPVGHLFFFFFAPACITHCMVWDLLSRLTFQEHVRHKNKNKYTKIKICTSSMAHWSQFSCSHQRVPPAHGLRYH